MIAFLMAATRTAADWKVRNPIKSLSPWNSWAVHSMKRPCSRSHRLTKPERGIGSRRKDLDRWPANRRRSAATPRFDAALLEIFQIGSLLTLCGRHQEAIGA